MKPSSLYAKAVLRKLVKHLELKKKFQDQEFTFNHDLFSSIREKSIKVREKPFNRQIQIEFHMQRYFFIVTFLAGSYPNFDLDKSPNMTDYFPLQISYRQENTSYLCECVANSQYYMILTSLITSHPIQIQRREGLDINDTVYRGPLGTKIDTEVYELFKERMEIIGFTKEYIQLCVDLARDKEKRLEAEWLEKVLNFVKS